MGERGCEGGWTLQARRTTTFLQIYWIDATAGLLDRIAIWIALLGQFGSWVRVWKKKTSMGSGVGGTVGRDFSLGRRRCAGLVLQICSRVTLVLMNCWVMGRLVVGVVGNGY
ncbi:hypothetical protein KY290_011816 [Solanum tuberosum]|uniref:Transmembrane protein n=1 Tax=Solanum tuberosum TaxID=4113 RepID=A0ABQ7W1R1_SOLTU|nr:hypothetical protein KY290_011816 [Solanum tuberosum]